MIHSKLTLSALIFAGLVAIGIGGAILFVPHTFYSSYGITLAQDVSLLNEMRAPDGFLLGAGLLMLLGIVIPSLTLTSLIIAIAVNTCYGVSRLGSMLLDGLPDSGLIYAAGGELAIALLCLVAFITSRRIPC